MTQAAEQTNADLVVKQELVNAATKQMVQLQEEIGTNGKVFIGSGDFAVSRAEETAQTFWELSGDSEPLLWDYSRVARPCVERVELPTASSLLADESGDGRFVFTRVHEGALLGTQSFDGIKVCSLSGRVISKTDPHQSGEENR